jgi:hypothetical protein
MKKNFLLNKDKNCLINNIENYKTNLDIDINEIIKKYSDLIIEYLKFTIENVKIKNLHLLKFIIIRGLDTMTNVFLYLLLYTKNIDIVYIDCQKSFYYYFEFVSQISEDENIFLNLTSRDAMIYVYKKTIFEIKKDEIKKDEIKKYTTDNNIINNSLLEMKEKIDIVNIYIKIYKLYLYKMIESYTSNVCETTINVIINNFKSIINKLNKLKNKEKVINLYNIIEKLYDKIEKINYFFEINELIIEKFLKNQNILKNIETKINSDDFYKMILNETNIFFKWLIK